MRRPSLFASFASSLSSMCRKSELVTTPVSFDLAEINRDVAPTALDKYGKFRDQYEL